MTPSHHGESLVKCYKCLRIYRHGELIRDMSKDETDFKEKRQVKRYQVRNDRIKTPQRKYGWELKYHDEIGLSEWTCRNMIIKGIVKPLKDMKKFRVWKAESIADVKKYRSKAERQRRKSVSQSLIRTRTNISISKAKKSIS